jgi:O-acetyl-ADP-ribose deacetylase (regulator of RNase III)
MDQNERLDYLIEQFKNESPTYRSLYIPEDREGKRRTLRALMNVRMPKILPASALAVQDAYLQERSRENGIVNVADIPAIAALGSRHSFGDRISLWQGDITRLAADAIVNAANSGMLGCFVPNHKCIDNCIHTFAGIQLRAECSRRMERLREEFGPDYEQPTAVPMLTDGYNLPARKVIHIVGPIVEEQLTPEHEELLAECYRSCLDLAFENGLKSVAFCGISTGVFHFPAHRAAAIAVRTVTDWLGAHPSAIDRVIFNVFGDEARRIYEQELLGS